LGKGGKNGKGELFLGKGDFDAMRESNLEKGRKENKKKKGGA